MQRNDSEDLSIFGDYSQLDQLTDGKVCSEDGLIFSIHKIVLVMKSVYFETLICGLNRDEAEFTVPEVSGRCLAEILRYIYTGQIFVTDENLVDILLAADYLLIPDIYREIKGRVKEYLTISNSLKVFQVANQIPCEDIASESFRVITTKWNEVIRTQKNVMCELYFETIELILSSGSLCVHDESTVWEIIVEWTQKDPPKRLCHVPQFLACLPSKELNENLSLNVLQHEIVSKNPLLKELQEQKSSGQFASNVEILSQFLESHSNCFKDSNGYRCPSCLHVIARRGNEDSEITELFITYDENLDLWRKIGDVEFQPSILEVVGLHVYLFDRRGTFMKFDLISKQRGQMQNFTFDSISSVCHINEYLYVAGHVSDDFEDIHGVCKVYDTLHDTWFDMTPPLEWEGMNIRDMLISTLGRRIYMTGLSEHFDDIGMQVFDTVTQEWSELSQPNDNMTNLDLVTYRRNIYVFRQSRFFETIEMHVFEPGKKLWRDPITFPYDYFNVKAIVINNNNMIVYDDFSTSIKSIGWDEAEKKWIKLEPNWSAIDFRKYPLTTVNDVNTVRVATKETRNQESRLQKSSFY